MTSFAGRVTHLASGDLWGGAEAFVHALASEQHRARPGSVSCVIMNPGQLAEALTRSGIPTIVLDETRAGFRDLLRSVAAHVTTFSPTVLHSHRRKENLLALLCPRRNRSVLVTTVHGMPEPVHGVNPLRRGLPDALNRAVLRFGFDSVVGVSKDVAARLTPRFPRGRVVCIHNGVRVPASVQTNVCAEGPLRLLALGRLVPIKRFDRLHELSNHLATSPLGRPQITLAGEGPLAPALRELFDVGSVSTVQMPGFVADTSGLLKQADALIMTSDHEGLPMAVLEALASGVPVFGFDVGGLPEIAERGAPLFLTPAGDVHALAESIAAFFSDRQAVRRVAPPADWSFDIRVCESSYAQLYAQLAARRR